MDRRQFITNLAAGTAVLFIPEIAGAGNLIETCGIIGSFMFGVCIFPQMYVTWKNKSAKGMNLYFLIAWLIGDILSMIYAVGIGAWPLLFNYGPSLIGVLYITYYYFKGRDNDF
jgi:uncharacterized protein with PQ loop repeat